MKSEFLTRLRHVPSDAQLRRVPVGGYMHNHDPERMYMWECMAQETIRCQPFDATHTVHVREKSMVLVAWYRIADSCPCSCRDA